MNPSDDDKLDAFLRAAADDPRPGEWSRAAARGLESRVLKRIAKPGSWSDAVFSLTSWRPLAAATAVVLLIGAWSARSVAEVFDDDWLTSQTAGETDDDLEDIEF
jgi:hypothetical protein